MNLKEKVALLFEITYSAKNTDDLLSAQQNLSLLKSDPSFLKTLFDIISDSNKDPEKKTRLKAIKKAAALFLKKYIEEKLEEEDLKHDEIYYFAQVICEGIYNPHISARNKIQFIIMLNNLMLNDLTNKITNDLRKSVSINLHELILHPNPGSPLMTGSFLLIRSILGSLRESLEISAFFNEIKTPFFELAKPFLSLNSTNFDDFIHQLKILRIWVETFRNFVIKFSDLKSNAWENLISNENIGSFLFEILRLSPPLNKQEENLLFCTSNSQKLNILLNELKSKTLKALNLIFELGINEGQRGFSFGIIQMSPFYIDLIYRSLIRTLTPSELNESSSFYLWEKTKEGLMIQALSFMKKACFLPQNNNFYQMNHHSLFYNILLPFLATSPQELSIFKENPDKFLDISMEYTSQKGFESLKGESCGLLKALGRNIDGFLTYVYFLMHEFMLFSVLSNKLEDIQGNYPKIKEIAYHKSFFLHIVSQETRIETSLMVFSVLNEDILRRKDLMESLEGLIVNLEEVLLNKKNTTDLIRSRVCLLFGYYGGSLFTEKNNKIFFKYLKYVVNSIKSKKSSPLSITLIAIDSLLKTVFNKKLRKRNVFLIKDVFKLFVKKLPRINYPQYYDLLESIIKSFHKTLIKHNEEDLLLLFHQLIQLVISRLQKTNKKTHKKTILLNKSLFLLEDLISFKCLPYSKQEDELVPLYDLLQKPNKINLSKEVFSLIVTAIEQQGSLGSSSIEKLFCIMPSCIRINNCQLEGSFQLINYFLYYGKGFVGANLGTLEQLVELASFCLSPSEGNEEEINQALAALIIQGIILNYNDIMGVELWDKIYTKVLNRVLEGIQSRFLKGCLCNIIWASFFTRFELMQELLLKSGKFNGIFEFILKEALVYSTVYDKKVFVLGACQILNSPFIDQSLIIYTTKIIDYLITNLKSLEEETGKLNKEIYKPNPMNEEVSEDENKDYLKESYDEFDNDNKVIDTELEYKEYIEKMFSFVNKMDEFDYFQKMITGLKERNFSFLQEIVNFLPEGRRNDLKDILGSRRVIIDEKADVSVPRKIFRVLGVKKN